ncbi:MAG: ScyD/ScyE family protein, partial [Streptosporangiales bacterium]|nr:ScyD/ScyE family protein [Streptosporangiales bacterium]
GKLLAVSGQSTRAVADIAAVELTENPDGTDVNPNPYAILPAGGHRTIVADAGGNDLITVDHGRTRVLTVFPLHGCGGTFTEQCDGHSVPTSLAWGRGGALYVGELAHFEPGEARVWKVSPWTGRPLGWYGKGGTLCRSDTTGFTTVTGVAFGPDGSMYVSELTGGADGGGDVVRITPNCHRSVRSVPLPAGLAVDRHGNVYVSAFGVSDSDGAGGVPPGQLWRLRF